MRRRIYVVFLLLSIACNSTREPLQKHHDGAKVIPPREMLNWDRYGVGEVSIVDDRTLRLAEGAGSKGIMLVSPKVYQKNVLIRYQVRTLNPQTVLVAILSLSDLGESDKLNVPAGYDGNNSWIQTGAECYFFAFCNAAHQATPFLRRFPPLENTPAPLAMHPKNLMTHGVWYKVEIGRAGAQLWFKSDGQTVLEAQDPAPLGPGRLSLRTRGTADGLAECWIRDVEIKS